MTEPTTRAAEDINPHDLAQRDKLVQLMVDWLRSLDGYDSPYVDDNDLDDVCIDGRFNMRHMADAILAFTDARETK